MLPRDEIATREKLEFESKQQISDLEPLRLEQFNLNYQKGSRCCSAFARGASAAAGSAGGAVSTQRILKSVVAQLLILVRISYLLAILRQK